MYIYIYNYIYIYIVYYVAWKNTSLIVCIYIWKNMFLFLMRISCEDHRLLGRFLCRRPSERRPHLRLTAKRGRRMSTKHLPKLCPTLEFDVFLRISMDFYKNHADSITFPGFFLSFSLSVPWTFARSFLSGRPGPSRAVPRRWKSAPSSPSKTIFKGFFSWSRPQVGTDRWWVECRLSEFSYTGET